MTGCKYMQINACSDINITDYWISRPNRLTSLLFVFSFRFLSGRNYKIRYTSFEIGHRSVKKIFNPFLDSLFCVEKQAIITKIKDLVLKTFHTSCINYRNGNQSQFVSTDSFQNTLFIFYMFSKSTIINGTEIRRYVYKSNENYLS